MVILLVLVAVIVWVVTAQEIARRSDLRVSSRALWIVATLLLPIFAIPGYWLTRPLGRKPARRQLGSEDDARTLAGWVPGWTLEQPGACEQVRAQVCQEPPLRPAPGFYAWLRSSGLAEKHPECAAKLLRCVLGGERRRSFFACPEIGALARVLEGFARSGDDLRAVKEQLRRLCPGMSSAIGGAAAETRPPALGGMHDLPSKLA